MNTKTDNFLDCIADSISYKLHLIQIKREALDAEHQDLMASEDWLSQGPHPEGAEYKGEGTWVHNAGGIFALSSGVKPSPAPGFDFLATSSAGRGVFKDLDQAVAFLDGVSQRQGICDGD